MTTSNSFVLSGSDCSSKLNGICLSLQYIGGSTTTVWLDKYHILWLPSIHFKSCTWEEANEPSSVCCSYFSFSLSLLMLIFMFISCSDLSNNILTGPIPTNGSFQLFTPIRFNELPFALSTRDASHCYCWLMSFCLSVSMVIIWILFLQHHLQLNRKPHLVLEVCKPNPHMYYVYEFYCSPSSLKWKCLFGLIKLTTFGIKGSFMYAWCWFKVMCSSLINFRFQNLCFICFSDDLIYVH